MDPIRAIDNIELTVFLEAIFLKYGYDFRNYSRASIKRRITQRLNLDRIANLSDMQHKVLHDKSFFQTLLLDLSVNVTEMFRDPSFYLVLRETVIPVLKTYPFIKIWHAGCSTGEEVYSMVILLKEEGLLEKALIYATDFNDMVLMKAREGIYPGEKIKEYTYNYQKAGGKNLFSDYYTSNSKAIIMDKSLKKNIVFSNHNLATDSVFGEMHMIMCRNVLIYFNYELQDKAVGLFSDSLVRKGILCLGSKESLHFSKYSGLFKEFSALEKIYQKKMKHDK